MGRERQGVYISPDVSHCHCPMANINVLRKKKKHLITGHMLEPHYGGRPNSGSSAHALQPNDPIAQLLVWTSPLRKKQRKSHHLASSMCVYVRTYSIVWFKYVCTISYAKYTSFHLPKIPLPHRKMFPGSWKENTFSESPWVCQEWHQLMMGLTSDQAVGSIMTKEKES